MSNIFIYDIFLNLKRWKMRIFLCPFFLKCKLIFKNCSSQNDVTHSRQKNCQLGAKYSYISNTVFIASFIASSVNKKFSFHQFFIIFIFIFLLFFQLIKKEKKLISITSFKFLLVFGVKGRIFLKFEEEEGVGWVREWVSERDWDGEGGFIRSIIIISLCICICFCFFYHYQSFLNYLLC